MPSYKNFVNKICDNCSCSYATKSPRSRFCSKRCNLITWRVNNPDKALANYQNRDKQKEVNAKVAYYTANKDRIIKAGVERASKRYHSDINFKLRKILRCRVLNALSGQVKGASVIENLGCSVEDLRKHLESKFLPGMTWGNHGINGWHIDHIEPLANFDLTDPEQVKIACRYTNLQPLWAKDNLTKADK